MADWRVTQHLFGDYAGPVPVLLVFRLGTLYTHLDAISSCISMRHGESDISEDDWELLCQIMTDHLNALFSASTTIDDIELVIVNNERDVRDKGNGLLLRLVSDGDLVGAYQMYDSDIEKLVVLDMQLGLKASIADICSNNQEDDFYLIENYLTKLANDPNLCVRNFKDHLQYVGYGAHYMIDYSGDEVDKTRLVTYEGPYNEIVRLIRSKSSSLQRVVEIAKRELHNHEDAIKAFISGLKIT